MTTSVLARSLHHVEEVMGMTVSFDVRSPLPEDGTLDRVIGWLHHVDGVFSTYKLDSEISRIGRGEVPTDQITEEVREVLHRCLDLTERSDGVFDAFAVPAPNGTTLDPSGFVKGWSLEVAAVMLSQAGAANFCVNGGGDIALRGRPGPGGRWRVGIRHPDHVDRQAAVLAGVGPLAVATSATYERGAHIIDPRTGHTATDVASATVVGPDLSEADAFATVVFVMGLAGLDWIEDQAGYGAYVITHDDTTHWSSGMDPYLVAAAA